MDAQHKMRVAKVSTVIAKRLGLNANHHARVWCDCMRDGVNPPGTWSHRTLAEVDDDPRRFGAWDCIGVIDLRIAGAAVEMFREHVRACTEASERKDVG